MYNHSDNLSSSFRFRLILGAIICSFAVSSCDPTPAPDTQDPSDFAGGDGTVFDASSHAFSFPTNGLNSEEFALHLDGDALFEQKFVTARNEVHNGLGPLFNNLSCVGCHPADGRGIPFLTGNLRKANALLLRLSLDGEDASGGPLPVPGFGGQLQHRSNFGVAVEGDFAVTFTDSIVSFADGEKVYLKVPRYTISNTYVPLPTNVRVSPRQAPPVFGLGLLEAISTDDLERNQDESDANGDGISGRANYVWNVPHASRTIGRFGWKANQPSLHQQTAGALSGDLGLTSSVFPSESSKGQSQDDGRGDDPEISDDQLKALTFYVQTLAVPGRRNSKSEAVKKGKSLFATIDCNKCHVESFTTSPTYEIPILRSQKIFPYTDLLLHDMGAGLADYRSDFKANGFEWKTPPLWGIGLSETVNGFAYFLHDGRARSFAEAIAWHSGEAENSKQKFLKLTKIERDAVFAFLRSL